MPLHRWFVPPGLYSAEDKKAIAAAIRQVYGHLPAFYVVTLFINVDEEDYFVGEDNRSNFVRICVENMARHRTGVANQRAFIDQYEKAISPWTQSRGIDWEVQMENGNPVYWNMNGMSPPTSFSPAMEVWKKENKVSSYEGTSVAEKHWV